jgi:hypothetical protein
MAVAVILEQVEGSLEAPLSEERLSHRRSRGPSLRRPRGRLLVPLCRSPNRGGFRQGGRPYVPGGKDQALDEDGLERSRRGELLAEQGGEAVEVVIRTSAVVFRFGVS